MKRIALINQTGGTGKSTTAVNLAAGLAMAGHRTVLIDFMTHRRARPLASASRRMSPVQSRITVGWELKLP